MATLRPQDEPDRGPPAPLLEVRALTVRFGAQTVLKDVNLAIPRGQTVAVIGESGCGKTVLLKTLVGLVRPASGTVHFGWRDVFSLTDRELTRERLRFGFVFQGAALFDSLSVFDNLAFALREHGRMPEREIRQRIQGRLQEVGLAADVLSRKPAELSGGMRKRVGLARAVAMDPEVMLYDEPTTGLDPIMSDVINELILRMGRIRPVTSVVVTHDMKTATKVCDRVVMLFPRSRLGPEESQVLYDGPPDQMEQSPDPRVRQFVRGEAGERLLELERQEP